MQCFYFFTTQFLLKNSYYNLQFPVIISSQKKKHKHKKHWKKAKKEGQVSEASVAEVAANTPSKIPQSPTVDESHKMESNDTKSDTGSRDTQNFGMTKVG